MSEAKIPLAGVIGCPVAHSKSPQLQRHWLNTYGIQGHYVPLHVEPGDLESVVRVLPKMGFVGANVTIPHKENVMALADQVTDRATLIGAANTLTFRDDGTILADNTDGYGFITNLHQGAPDWDPASGPAVVLGAGGACRAVVASLLEAGVPEVILTNRTRGRADQLREDFGSKIRVVEWVQVQELFELQCDCSGHFRLVPRSDQHESSNPTCTDSCHGEKRRDCRPNHRRCRCRSSRKQFDSLRTYQSVPSTTRRDRPDALHSPHFR